jgi:hypothetical protein
MSSTKRRKTETSTNGGKTKANDAIVGDGYESLSLQDIQERINQLCHRVPIVPEGGIHAEDQVALKDWAAKLKAVIEEFDLLVGCISTATYKWGSERSGAANQHLGVLSGELAHSQDQISSTVTPRLTNVLVPVVELVIDRTITTKDSEGREIKENVFTRKQADPDFVKLCAQILSRNALLLRQVVLANFHKIHRCLEDYMQAQKKDSSHDRGFAY